MIVQAPSPKGVDYNLQKFQALLHTHLIAKWGLNANDATGYMCYDRCYRNQTKDAFVPEVYTSAGNYKELLVDDKVKALSFFGVESPIQYSSADNSNTANIHLIFFVNLKKLKATDNRPDEAVRQDVQEFLSQEKYSTQLESIEFGIDKILTEYNGFTGIKFRDLQPLHCFRFNLTMRYSYSLHECT